MFCTMNYNYTEEHYAEMYNNLPEGLKDLVLSGRLAIQVSAIGSRHGLNADQVADLEPAVEDVCLGLILKTQLAENIKTQVGVDDRVSNRIAAEVEIEILRPFEPELIIARQQKEDLDKKISSGGVKNVAPAVAPTPAPVQQVKKEFEPKDVSEKSNVSAIKNFYNAGNAQVSEPGLMDSKDLPDSNKPNASFSWDDLGKKTQVQTTQAQSKTPETSTTDHLPPTTGQMSVDEKIDKLTDTINLLVQNRFGEPKKDDGISDQMKELMKRLEIAEKENQENKKLIQKLQNGNQLNSLQNSTQNIFDLPKDANKINVDKPRSVSIDKSKAPTTTIGDVTGNVKVESTKQNSIPVQKTEPKPEQIKPEPKIYSSVVSQATADTIVETRNKENHNISVSAPSSAKKVLSLDELLTKNDQKIKEAKPTTAQIVFPTIGTEKKIDIKNVAQTDGLRQTLLDDIAFLKKKISSTKPIEQMTKIQQNIATSPNANVTPVVNNSDASNSQQDTDAQNKDQDSQSQNDLQNLTSAQTSVTLGQFKDELIPKTKEDRMKALQDKIKAMNKGVSVGGANSIAASALDPYKL